MKWQVLALTGALIVAAPGCGANEEASTSGRIGSRSDTPSLDDANPEGIPRFGAPFRIVAGPGGVLTSDNAIQAEIRWHPAGVDADRVATSPRRVFRPDIAAVGNDFVMIGEDCGTFTAEPDREPACDPGGFVLQRYAPATDTWTVIAEGLAERPERPEGPRLGPGVARLVTVDAERAVVWFSAWERNQLVEVDLTSGDAQALADPGVAGFAENDDHRVFGVCPSDGDIAVLSVDFEVPSGAPAEVARSTPEGGWTTDSIELPTTLTTVSQPACAGDRIVSVGPAATVVTDGRGIDVVPDVPEGPAATAVTTGPDGRIQAWAGTQVWTLDQRWAPSGDLGEGVVVAAAVVEDRIAVFRYRTADQLRADFEWIDP